MPRSSSGSATVARGSGADASPSRPVDDEAARRIEALVGRYGLPAAASGQLRSLVAIVARDPLAPTAVRDPHRVIDDHIADSLVGLELEPARTAGSIADLGAGAGFPALPLAIACPQASVALVESSTRKCAFLTRAVAACGVVNAQVVHARVESWPDGAGRFDLVTARALAPLPVVVEYGAPLLRIGGALVVWRGHRDRNGEQAAAAAAAQLGLETREPLPVYPYAGVEHRYLHAMVKVRRTPDGFPRRPGIARKRPLGGRPGVSPF